MQCHYQTAVFGGTTTGATTVLPVAGLIIGQQFESYPPTSILRTSLCQRPVRTGWRRRCTQHPKSWNTSGLSGIWAQKSGTVPKVRKSQFLHGKNPKWRWIALKWAKSTFFIIFNFSESRLFAPYCLLEIYLLKGVAAEFWITQFTQVTMYVYLVKYNGCFLCVWLFIVRFTFLATDRSWIL